MSHSAPRRRPYRFALVLVVDLFLVLGLAAAPSGAQPAADGDLPGVRRGEELLLRSALTSGPATEMIGFGRAGDVPLVGDWDGDGVDDLGVWRDGTFLLDTDGRGGRAEIVFGYGRASDVPVVGDWDGDGVDGVGVRRGSRWLLRNRLRGGRAQISFGYGRASDVPVVGDWDGDGVDGVGVRRANLWLLRNRLRGGRAQISFGYGRASDEPVVGDWDGVGRGPRSGEIIGRGGPLFRYRVIVDPDTGVGAADFGRVVDGILGDPRSWTAAGDVRFQRVPGGPAEIVIRLATPAAVDTSCAPLRTIGYYSCTRGGQVILNRDRWLRAVPFWTAGLPEYRRYLVNHEVGHALGHGHVRCPGPGRRALVMQQQSISLQGCVENGWPYP